MAYTTIDKPSDYFETILFTGNGSNGHAISGLDFQPDWVWLKNRNTGNTHEVFDSVRGATKTLYPDRADAEYVNSTGSLTSFNSDGFTVGSGDGANKSGSGIASWNWKAGTSFTNDASATGIGSIDSAGSSNQTAGFSIVSYTSNGSSSQSVAHNLGGVPEMIISKNRDSGSASYNYWTVYHHSLATANDKKLKLNTTDAASSTNEWGDTDPTSTVYSLHTSGDGTTNHSTDKMISYCFRSIKGYSKFGSYTGNGNANDGTFVYTGFAPAFVMAKRTDSTSQWCMVDNKRPGYNIAVNTIFANSSEVEATDLGVNLLSNGFKEDTTNNLGASGGTYIYMAFAENPFVTSTGVPATAR